MLKKNSIFSKLFFSYSFIIVLSFLLFMAVFFYLFHLNLYKQFEEIYHHQYVQIEKQLHNQKQFKWSDSETAEILNSSFYQPGYHIYIVDQSGNQIFGPNNNQLFSMIPNHEEILNEVKAGNKVSDGGFVNGELQYTVANMLTTNVNEVDQPMMVMIFHELNHEYERVIWMILLTFIIAIIFAGIILWFMSKRITAPLREMSEIARSYAKGDFSKTVQYELNDEIGQLAKSFTYMADELNHLESTRRQYISNVSHELRSPLTSIKGFIIALLDGTIPTNRHGYYLNLMKDETERMIKLVNDTLDMNQLEEGHQKLVRTNYNITDQIKSIIQKLSPHCTEKQLQIRLRSSQDFFVFADKERIEQVIVNLIHNAIQFSTLNSFIDITLTQEEQHVKLQIQDYGIGIDERQLDLIWRRFYKVDESRTNKSGAGLGLAIVKSIIDLHETDINVQSKIGKGTTFSFKLPLTQSEIVNKSSSD